MNHRISEKVHKRKWQQLFSTMYAKVGIMTKPSRIKISHQELTKKSITITGITGNYKININFVPKTKEAADGEEEISDGR